jgi:predicted nuclease of predicted toxin-antitoxin system
VRLLLDECVPRRLRRELSDHEVRTVPEMGWAAKKNGELLQLASDRFDVFITTDQRLIDQQHVARFSIAVAVLVARRNKIEFLVPLIPKLRRTLNEVQPGRVYTIDRL